MIADAYDGGWEDSVVAGVAGVSSVADDTADSSRSDQQRSAASTPPSTIPPTSDDGIHGFWKSPRATPSSRGPGEPHPQHKTGGGAVVLCSPSIRGDVDGYVAGGGIRTVGVKHARPSWPDEFDRRRDGRGEKRIRLAAASRFADVGGGDAQLCEAPIEEEVTVVDLAKVPQVKRRGQILELDSAGAWRDASLLLSRPQQPRRAGKDGTSGEIRGIRDDGRDGKEPAEAPASGNIFAMLRTHQVRMAELFGTKCVVCKVVDGDGDVGHGPMQCPKTRQGGRGAGDTRLDRMIEDNGRVARTKYVKAPLGCCWGCFRVQPKPGGNPVNTAVFGCRGLKQGGQWPCDERGENVRGFGVPSGKGLSLLVVAWVVLLATRPWSASEETLRRLGATDDIIGKLREDSWWANMDVAQWALGSIATGWSAGRKEEVRTWMSREMGFHPNDRQEAFGVTRMAICVSELL